VSLRHHNSDLSVMHITEIGQRRARTRYPGCFSTVINSHSLFCYVLAMMNTNGRILCIALFVSMLLVGVSALADTPVATDDSVITAEDSTVTFSVLANDTGLTDTPITVTIITGPSVGAAHVNVNNTITYEPIINFNGTDTLTYQVKDTDGETSTAQVTVAVVSVNDAPVLVDNLFATEVDTPVTITLRATDPELDTFYPEDDLLTFAIVNGPSHGTIDGGLTQLTYETPHTAIVILTYTPNAGFSGDDDITFSVTDIDGAISTAQIYVKVGVPPETGLLSGRWTGSFTFDGQSFSFTAFTTSIAAVYQIGSFRTQATATWSMDSFTSFNFNTSFPLGELSITSSLSFDPMGPDYFRYWQTTTRSTIFDFNLSHTFYLAASQTDSYTLFVGTWQIEDMSVTSTTRLTGLTFCFASENITARWGWPGCDIDTDAHLSITQQGFDYFSFTFRNIPILPPDTIGIGIFLKATTTFSLTSKDIDATIYCQSDWLDCFRVLCEVIGGDGVSIDGVSLYGLQFQTTFPGGVSVRDDTAFAEEKNASLTGYSEYFERFTLSGPTESCCGSPGSWNIRTYFQCTSTTLFDWGMTSISATEVLTDAVRFSIGFNFRAAAPIWQITIGWQVNW